MAKGIIQGFVLGARSLHGTPCNGRDSTILPVHRPPDWPTWQLIPQVHFDIRNAPPISTYSRMNHQVLATWCSLQWLNPNESYFLPCNCTSPQNRHYAWEHITAEPSTQLNSITNSSLLNAWNSFQMYYFLFNATPSLSAIPPFLTLVLVHWPSIFHKEAGIITK